MPIAIPIALGVSAVAGVAGAAMSSSAAGKAASTQAQAADHAAVLQKQAADEALAFNREQWNTQQAQQKPWLTAGTTAINSLSDKLAPGGDLSTHFGEQWHAPTAVTEMNDPGYQFRLAQGRQALERSAAARGNLLTGGTAKAINGWAQNNASSEYGNVYNRSLTDYTTRYNQFNQDQNTTFNHLAAVSGMGQTTAAQLGQEGAAAAAGAGNILMTSANNIGNSEQNAAYQRASGYIGSASAWNGALSNVGKTGINYLSMSQAKAPSTGVTSRIYY